MASKSDGASRGLLAGIEETGKKVKEEKGIKVNRATEITVDESNAESTEKRSYILRKSTVRKLKELRLFILENEDLTYSEIVDEAVNAFYEMNKHRENNG